MTATRDVRAEPARLPPRVPRPRARALPLLSVALPMPTAWLASTPFSLGARMVAVVLVLGVSLFALTKRGGKKGGDPA